MSDIESTQSSHETVLPAEADAQQARDSAQRVETSNTAADDASGMYTAELPGSEAPGADSDE